MRGICSDVPENMMLTISANMKPRNFSIGLNGGRSRGVNGLLWGGEQPVKTKPANNRPKANSRLKNNFNEG